MVAISQGYIDRDLLKNVLRAEITDEWDEYLDLLILAASDAVERFTNRVFTVASAAEARDFTGSGVGVMSLPDFHSLQAVALDVDDDGVHEVTLTVGTDVIATPTDSDPKKALRLRSGAAVTEFPKVEGGVRVTTYWGWPSVPDTVRQAVLLMASRWFKRKDVSYSDLPPQVDIRVLDADVQQMLKPLRRFSGLGVIVA